MTSTRPPTKNNNSYNPAVNAGGKALAAARDRTWTEAQRTLNTPRLDNNVLYPFGAEFTQTIRGRGQNKAAQNFESSIVDLTKRYPFTYTIPEEKKFAVRRRFTNEDGTARYVGDRPPLDASVMGKVYVGPEYFDYVAKEMEREEAEAFKCFVFNNMDISDPVKKEYWKKKCPALFEELLTALAIQRATEFKRDMILLYSPQNEEEFEFLYEQLMKPDQYTSTLSPAIAPQRNVPTMPWPQATDRSVPISKINYGVVPPAPLPPLQPNQNGR